ncbi:ChbG/HpnK family deacetylase [Streptococcus caviae]|uniref:ChbG/HpnK family deacetylase n=1 Tax=Streptococcus sp. 'caviae' TaxID=1915004 RepID=UPI00094BAB54|nr:ChbG/HpnK family deacetylase [Streptococcus sp. 'caviae']OLN82319.1 PTS sugar transporter [Streptococcus sp. 'caviae']
MVKKLLLRADDLGYSESINYGIEKSIKDGLIRSLGVMVNMPATQHGVDLIKDYDIALGVHTNICAEKPLTDPSLIQSLVDENGYFKSSKVYRSSQEDFVVFDEVVLEIEAQYHKFIDLFGCQPDYFEGHAVASTNFFKGLEYVADKYNLKYSGFPVGNRDLQIGDSLVQFNMESMLPNYNPFDMIKRMVEKADDKVVQLAIFHPGYLDDYILTHSSLTVPRTKEVTVLIDTDLKNYLHHKDVTLLDYRDL